MDKPESLGTIRSQAIFQLGIPLLALVCLAPVVSHAQAAAEAAATTSGAAGMTAAIGSKLPASLPSALPATSVNAAAGPLPMGVREGPAVEEANRKAFEQRAGKDGAKLLLRSEPSQALIYVEGKSVGVTPLLLLVAPGKYHVEMRGQHQEFGGGDVDLAANQTREYLLTLTPRFVTSVTVHPTPGAVVIPKFDAPANTAAVPAAAAARVGDIPGGAAPSGPPPEEANRKLLEGQAGSDAAKLELNSNPAEAQVYIDGIYVGRAPVELRLAPGRHQVIMRGNEGSGGQMIGLLPKETQQVTISVAPLYPSQVSIHWPQSGGSQAH